MRVAGRGGFEVEGVIGQGFVGRGWRWRSGIPGTEAGCGSAVGLGMAFAAGRVHKFADSGAAGAVDFGFGSAAVGVAEDAARVVEGLEVGMEEGVGAEGKQLAADGAVAVGEGIGGREGDRAGSVGGGGEEGEGVGTGSRGTPVRIGGGLVAVGGDGAVFIEGEGVDLGGGGVGVGFGGEAGGTGERGSGDLEGVEDGAGAIGLNVVGEESVDDLGGDEADGGVIFKEGDGDLGGGGEGGMAVAGVGVAKVGVVEGIVFAAPAFDGEGAALGRGFGVRVEGGGIGVEGGGIDRHGWSPSSISDQ